MKSGIFKLDWASILDAFITAIVFAVIAGLLTLVHSNGFDVFTANWALIGESMVNWAFVAGVVSLGQSFLSDNQGNVLKIKTN